MAKIVAIDAMTNERGVKVLSKALGKSLSKHSDLEIILVGEGEVFDLERERASIHPAYEKINSDDSLLSIRRKLKDTSTYHTVKLVEEGIRRYCRYWSVFWEYKRSKFGGCK
jgi:fatty acid/phospholipid biosynthesis enzyme